MASKNFTTWSQLELYLTEKINDSLKHEVSEQVKDEIESSISDIVYSAGSPSIYERRGGNIAGGMGNALGTGSIADKSTMTSELISSGQIKVTPEAERNMDYKFAGIGYDTSKSLAENIINGYGNEWYSLPRDFISDTKENIISSKSHVSSLKEALRKRGLTVV